jgi:NADH-quinone oxidoreductase subunit M
MERVIFGAINNKNVESLKDINKREGLFLLILSITVLIMGLWPAPFLDTIHTSVDRVLALSSVTKL